MPLVDLRLQLIPTLQQLRIARRKIAHQAIETLPERLLGSPVPGNASWLTKSYRTRAICSSPWAMMVLTWVTRSVMDDGIPAGRK
jgi:hypothetical protein